MPAHGQSRFDKGRNPTYAVAVRHHKEILLDAAAIRRVQASFLTVHAGNIAAHDNLMRWACRGLQKPLEACMKISMSQKDDLRAVSGRKVCPVVLPDGFRAGTFNVANLVSIINGRLLNLFFT